MGSLGPEALIAKRIAVAKGTRERKREKGTRGSSGVDR